MIILPLLVITGNITSKGPGGACVRRRGRLCHGTIAQWPVQACLTLTTGGSEQSISGFIYGHVVMFSCAELIIIVICVCAVVVLIVLIVIIAIVYVIVHR